MAVGVLDSLGGVGDGEALCTRLSIDVIRSSAVDREVGLLVDNSSRPGVGTSAAQVRLVLVHKAVFDSLHLLGGIPEGAAEIDTARLVSIDVCVCARSAGRAVVGRARRIGANEGEVRANSRSTSRSVGAEPGGVASGTRADSVEVGGGSRDVRVSRGYRSGDLGLAGGAASNVCDALAEGARLDLGQAL